MCIKRTYDFPLLTFKDIDHKFKPHACYGCHDILMMVYELKTLHVVKGVAYRCFLWNMTRNDRINMLRIFKLDDKGTL